MPQFPARLLRCLKMVLEVGSKGSVEADKGYEFQLKSQVAVSDPKEARLRSQSRLTLRITKRNLYGEGYSLWRKLAISHRVSGQGVRTAIILRRSS